MAESHPCDCTACKTYCPEYCVFTWAEKLEEASPNMNRKELADHLEYLIKEHTLDIVLESLVKALKRLKNPEWLVFKTWLFIKRAMREITKDVSAPQLTKRSIIEIAKEVK